MTSGLCGSEIVHKIAESMTYHGIDVVIYDVGSTLKSRATRGAWAAATCPTTPSTAAGCGWCAT
ncbi:MAG TPA: hypothetical protein VNO83_15550 [Pseudonocardia sp.]|nr:hypothetical protein [Pseudonocardia sp.]